MLDLLNLMRLVSTTTSENKITEDFDQLTICANSNNLITPSETIFADVKALFLKYGDKIVMTVRINGYDDDLLVCDLATDGYDDLVPKIEECISMNDDGNEFQIHIRIEKDSSKDFIVVYDSKCFASYLSDLVLADLLQMIKERIYDRHTYLVFVNEKIHSIESGIVMVNEIQPIRSDNICFYEDHEHCHCVTSGNSLLLPSFYFSHNSANSLSDLFNRLSIISSICHLASYCEINDNHVFVKCIGYKNILGEIGWSNSFDYSMEIYRVCEWVYAGKNIEDKRGLFLNVLSLNIETVAEMLILKEDIYDSVISSHELYLKENVNQYIHVKSVFIDHQISLLSNINEIVDNIIDNFKKNFTGFFAFIISVVVLNSISTGKIDNIFNNTIALISYLLLSISLLMLAFSIIEIAQKWKRQRGIIENTKKEYSDVLSRNDIEHIFEKSINLKAARTSLIRNAVIFGVIWLICIVLIFLTIRYLNSLIQNNSTSNIRKT